MNPQPLDIYYSKFSPVVRYGLPDYDRDSDEWHDWVEEQKNYFDNGFEVGGTKITGRMYWQLNFMNTLHTQQRANGEKYKTEMSPFYVDYQKEIYDLVDWCMLNEEDLLVAKARDKFFSEIISSIALFETQLRENVSILALFPGGQSKAQVQFKEKYDRNWGQLLPDFKHYPDGGSIQLLKYQWTEKDEYGQEQTYGNKSSITMIPAVNADVGKSQRPKIIFIEEFGEINNPLRLIKTNEANMREGDVKFGFTMAGGTSNAFNEGFKDFRTLWYHNKQHRFQKIFVPAQKGYFPFVDYQTGKSDEEGALKRLMERRKDLTGELLMVEQQNYPTSIEEMFTVLGKSPFNGKYIAKQVGRIETDESIGLQVGNLIDTDEGVKFRKDPNGLWHILKHPDKTLVNKDVIATDPYRLKDVANEQTASKGAIVVRRPFQGIDKPGQMSIAYCLMREENKEMFFNECLKAEKYWDAMNLIEYTDEDIITHHIVHQMTKYLRKRPRVLDSAWSKVTNQYGVVVTPESKGRATEMAVQEFNQTWENEFFLAILEDLSKFGPEENTDLGMAYIWSIVHAIDNVALKQRPKPARSDNFQPYFVEDESGNQIWVDTYEFHKMINNIDV